MRDYGRVAPTFWTGETGKALRKMGADHQIVALYLMSSPASNMLGLYYLPYGYISNDVGMKLDKVHKVLGDLQRLNFCSYDPESEWVFVVEMARFQISDQLKPDDKRVPWILTELTRCASALLRNIFLERYRDDFNLGEAPPPGPSKRNKIPSQVRWKVFQRDKHTCQYCGRGTPLVKIEVDHKVPCSEGGKSVEDNLITCCWECNNGKSNKPLPQALQGAISRPSSSQDQDQDQDQEQEQEQEQKDVGHVEDDAARPVVKSAATYEAYAGAYRRRYGAEPVRNRTVSAMLCKLVDKLGAEEAPLVAAFYVTHRSSWYAEKMHPVNLLLQDAEKLRTEWATGRQALSRFDRPKAQPKSLVELL